MRVAAIIKQFGVHQQPDCSELLRKVAVSSSFLRRENSCSDYMCLNRIEHAGETTSSDNTTAIQPRHFTNILHFARLFQVVLHWVGSSGGDRHAGETAYPLLVIIASSHFLTTSPIFGRSLGSCFQQL